MVLFVVHVGSLLLLGGRFPDPLGDRWGGVMTNVVPCGMASLGLPPPIRGKTEAGPLLLGVCAGSAVVAAGMKLARTLGRLDRDSATGAPLHGSTAVVALVSGPVWGMGAHCR